MMRQALKHPWKDNKKEYAAWYHMIRRCTDSSCHNYEDYGGRGIKVCDRWLNSFDNFVDDMGKAPSKAFSLDRVDNNGNYEPSNCRWATPHQQKANCRNNRDIVGVVAQKNGHGNGFGWRAYIQVNGVLHRKLFRTKQEAIEQRLTWERRYL